MHYFNTCLDKDEGGKERGAGKGGTEAREAADMELTIERSLKDCKGKLPPEVAACVEETAARERASNHHRHRPSHEVHPGFPYTAAPKKKPGGERMLGRVRKRSNELIYVKRKSLDSKAKRARDKALKRLKKLKEIKARGRGEEDAVGRDVAESFGVSQATGFDEGRVMDRDGEPCDNDALCGAFDLLQSVGSDEEEEE